MVSPGRSVQLSTPMASLAVGVSGATLVSREKLMDAGHFSTSWGTGLEEDTLLIDLLKYNLK